jgi:hypothetical protein
VHVDAPTVLLDEGLGDGEAQPLARTPGGNWPLLTTAWRTSSAGGTLCRFSVSLPASILEMSGMSLISRISRPVLASAIPAVRDIPRRGRCRRR